MCITLKISEWLGTLAKPFNGQLSSANYQPSVLTQARVFISGYNMWSTRQATIYAQTNDGGKGQVKTNCVGCFVSECQVVSVGKELEYIQIGFKRKRWGSKTR